MTESILFSLLRIAIGSETADNSLLAKLNEDTLKAVYVQAKRHDMAHLLAPALEKIGWCSDGNLAKILRQQNMQAVYRCARQQYEFEEVTHQLESANIPYVPLKGAFIRNCYPEPWMRTSTDVDILIRNEDLEEGRLLLTEKLGYKHEYTAFYNASLFSPSGMHLELHYMLADDGAEERVRQHLLQIWDHVSPSKENNLRYEIDEGWFYLYHIFHMTKHFLDGGCGIKPFLDIWIMKKKWCCTAQKHEALLERCGLLAAARAYERLSDVWFSGAPADDLSRRLALVVLDGGVHGTIGGNVLVRQVRKGGKLKSIWQKIFLPYDTMKEFYPILCKHKWLLPFIEILRWCKLILGKRLVRTVKILWHSITLPNAERDNAERLLRELGLL